MSFVTNYGFIQRLALTGVLAAFAGVAHASIITYNLDGGTTTGGGTVTGTLTIDTGTDLVTAGDLAFSGTPSGDFEFNIFNYSGIDFPGENFAEISADTLNHLYVDYYTSNIGTGSLSTDYVIVDISGTYYYNIGGATLDPVSSAPEPSSLVLLGTGILGLAGFARRRFLTA